jgi:hypothetical protein
VVKRVYDKLNESKEEELEELKTRAKEVPERERNEFLIKSFVKAIMLFTKRLVKYEGYSRVKKILEREIIEMGRRDARKGMELLNLKDVRSKEDVSKVMKFIALVLGFQLEVRDGETYIKNCPFAVISRDANEPLLTEICSWYCKGIAQELIGEEYEWFGFHNFMKDPTECYFTHSKKRT